MYKSSATRLTVCMFTYNYYHMFRISHLFHKYKIYKGEKEKPEEKTALEDLSIHLEKGKFLGILGRNGSGKSTLALHLAALLKPTSGTVLVEGKDSSIDENLLPIRKTTGIVFQNPDNQMVGSTVEEDIAFGPENLGIEPVEIDRRIDQVLDAVGLTGKRICSPNTLSGGQKQKVAISGILAMEPECMIFDEATAMTDPEASGEIGRIVRSLHNDKGITILYITHDLSEVEDADELYVMDSGRLVMSGQPASVFQKPERMRECGLSLPPWLNLLCHLRSKGMDIPESIVSETDLVSYMISCLYVDRDPKNMKEKDLKSIDCRNNQLVFGNTGGQDNPDRQSNPGKSETTNSAPILELSDISFHYPGDSDSDALSGISLNLYSGECIALIGASGSGKSTLFSHMNGLLKPDYGRILFRGKDIWAQDYSRKKLRKEVGLCFQNPEHQLFADTVLEDVAFGPLNMGLDPAEAREKAGKALRFMGIPESYDDQSPFLLSGGEQRRVALAGILAMEPSILVLDEPAAGLDEEGKQALFSLISTLVNTRKMTVIFSSHSMEDAAETASRVLVMDDGKLIMDGSPAWVFSRENELKAAGLDIPWVRKFLQKVMRENKDLYEWADDGLPVNMAELTDWILERKDRR